MEELFGDTLISKTASGTAEVRTEDALRGKYVGVYFSAHWCPPCRAFTPALRKCYLRLTGLAQPDVSKALGVEQEAPPAFEVVFVSSDDTEQKAMDYYQHNMPWLMVPWTSAGQRASLSRHFGVMGIPTLVILDPQGKVVCANARSALIQDPEGKSFPWAGQADASLLSETLAKIWPYLLAVLAIWLWQWWKGQ
ncbi:thioredoxin-like-domain-containing protein [Haematococcus lacustris]